MFTTRCSFLTAVFVSSNVKASALRYLKALTWNGQVAKKEQEGLRACADHYRGIMTPYAKVTTSLLKKVPALVFVVGKGILEVINIFWISKVHSNLNMDIIVTWT